MSSNAEELNSQAEELKAAVSYFKLDNRAVNTHFKTNKSSHTRKPVKMNYKEIVGSSNGSGNGNGNGHAKGFDLKLDDGPSDSDFTEI